MINMPKNFFKVKEDASAALSRAAEIERQIDFLREETRLWTTRRADGMPAEHNIVAHLKSAAFHAAKTSAYLLDALGSAVGDPERPSPAGAGASPS
ncbi:MAG TPA: hypothetical protein VM492_13565 [Sumerlaeia bacterium]|nr:hypothetical protein [Sumerlaeia bacterium]